MKTLIRKRKALIKKPENKKAKCFALKAQLEELKREWDQLLQAPTLAHDAKYLRRMALSLKQLYHSASKDERYAQEAAQIQHFLSTPLGAPFITRLTLLKAADLFGEHEPKHSALGEILSCIAAYGPHFTPQLFRIFA